MSIRVVIKGEVVGPGQKAYRIGTPNERGICRDRDYSDPYDKEGLVTYLGHNYPGASIVWAGDISGRDKRDFRGAVSQ